MAFLILIEGLDLAGKSTLAQALLRQLQPTPTWLGVDCLCADNPVARVAQQSTAGPGYELSCLHMASHLWDLRNFHPNTTGIHIQDSCWLRHKACDRRQGIELPWEAYPGPTFSVVIFLTAAIPVRQWRYRMRQRKQGLPYDNRECSLLSQPDQFLAVEHHLRKELDRHPCYLEIDTSKLTSQETLARALAFVQTPGNVLAKAS